MTIGTYFKRSEFSCKCGCGFNTVDFELLLVLQRIRNHFGRPLTITSGNRCVKHNKSIGGAENSQHTKGMAADIKVKDISVEEIYEFLDKKYPDVYGIGKYSSWIHVDVREEKARWSK